MQVVCPGVDDDTVWSAKVIFTEQTKSLVCVAAAIGSYTLTREQSFGIDELPIGVHEKHHLRIRRCGILWW